MNKIFAVFAFILASSFCLPVYAGMMTINLNSVFTGATPSGPAPWLQATFAYNVGDTSGTLVLNSLLKDGDFLQGSKNGNGTTGWAFYLDPLVQSASCTNGNCADLVQIQNSVNTGPTGLGNYNLGFNWDPKGRFVAGDSATYDLMFSSPLSSSPFIANDNGFMSAAHIQGIGTAGSSSWVTDGPTDVPEPSQLSVLLIGLLGFGGVLYARRRHKADPRHG